MKKFILLLLLFPLFSVYSLEYPMVNSKVVEIYDLTDKSILYDVGANDVISIASLTKIATTITAIESIDNLDEEVLITSSMLRTVSSDASVAGLKSGDRLTYRDLLYASMLPSGADATNSLAILISGSIDNFVIKMNELVQRLNLQNTHFLNVTGLDKDGHYSTADDVRKLLEYAIKNPIFKEVFTAKKYEMSNGKVVKTTLYKYNAAQSDFDKIIGSKTGFTDSAGYCLAALSNINGHDMFIIVLNAVESNNVFYNISDGITLIDYMNSNYKNEILVRNGDLIKSVPINLSKMEKYDIYSDNEVKKFLPSDYNIDNLRIEYNGLEKLSFRNHKGDKIGSVSYYFDDELLYEQDIYLKIKIDLDFIKLIKEYYILIIFLFIIFVFFIFLIKRKIR